MHSSVPHKIYSVRYDDPGLRGEDLDPRPWDILDLIREESGATRRLLDVGSGTLRKILPLVSAFAAVIGIEPSRPMRCMALARCREGTIQNACVIGGLADALPFSDGTFDVATSLLAIHNAAELARVVKPSGFVLVEKIGERDKANIKEAFGRDESGNPRGQFLLPEGHRQLALRREFEQCFPSVKICSGRWRTRLSYAGLLQLLKETNTIRNFDLMRDADCLERVRKECDAEGRIDTEQHRLLIIARKGVNG
jgi:SAM-dependent methyltransferase